jgi:hypothetical protein
VKPSSFSELAKLLSGMSGPSAESAGRTAVSRSYYAAILEARDRLDAARAFKIKKHEMHDMVMRAFYFADAPEVKKIGRMLKDLKALREEADYQLADEFDRAVIGEAAALCSGVQEGLETADFGKCDDPTGRGRS